MIKYLEQLFNTNICNVDVYISKQGNWLRYLDRVEPQAVQGKYIMTISFESNSPLEKMNYGSIRVNSFDTVDVSVFSYKCNCFVGKETKELLSKLGEL